MGKITAKIEKGVLVLRCVCTRCGGEVARVIENERSELVRLRRI